MKKLALTLIRLYKTFVSPGRLGIKVCRFEPSCSRYTYEAIQKYGILKGALLGLYRFLRCNPFNKGGYDPVK
ncbi:membrane protein insertion efficiency factor YidD [Candidatus Nomurabacteria bacterium]|uniref:Putative membrane protein insertion efficiency factor n=1 Tax=candidate division WWE3 bacterium TaxID=2053526 RepID=A0A955E006_UNCKA|nr:membrane protein insertion efficiency factor YidD [candidate division WWE3 bacterium]MCB9823502.1 membrane protein insertion efficiency factor YidD [Candidatus Nomurabacteria bacterium]MCB9827784.1 membrane protein insertion efficiency factor YidD [Candidatus Nomurabacteria bacterium]HXK52389.1 membrane protein insertion efficiency factor YidD [bacterium]